MNNITKITNSLEDSNVIIDGITKTVKHEKEKLVDGVLPALLAPLTSSLVHPVILFSSKSHKWKRSKNSRRRIH